MKKLLTLSFIWLLFFSASGNDSLPNLSKKEDLKALGTGKITEKDGSSITKIILYEVTKNGIVYLKNESLHDIAIDDIGRIEFLTTPWGPLEIRFADGNPKIVLLKSPN